MRLDHSSINISTRETRIYWVALALLIFTLLPSSHKVKLSLIHSGYVAQHSAPISKIKQLAQDLTWAPINYLSADTSIPTIKLDIRYQDWLKLEADRDAALSAGIIPEKRNQVNAIVYHESNKFKAKVRLQGDMLDHLSNATRWSLRIELKQKKALFSSRRFALVSPHVRIHQGPRLFSETLKTAGFDIISPQHIPVRLLVNGVDWGVMLFEPAFSQSLLAVNARTEGLITRLDLYEEKIENANSTNLKKTITRTVLPRVLQRKTILKNSALRKQRQIALSLLNDFFSGKRPASDVFDPVKLGQYLATVDSWGAWHALTWNNWRWYYNPHTARLEPIQSDVAVTPAKHIWLMRAPSQSLTISKKMLEDPIIVQHYDRALKHLQSLIDSNKLSDSLREHEHPFIKKLHRSAPLTGRYDFSILRQQTKCIISGYEHPPCSQIPFISADLHINMDRVTTHPNWDLLSNFVSTKNNGELRLINNNKRLLRIKGITGTTRFGEIDLLDEINADFPLALESNSRKTIELPQNIASVVVRAGLAGKKMGDFEFIRDIKPDTFIPRPISDASTAIESIRQYPFIQQADHTWRITRGEWKINDYLRTPDNWQLIIDPGVTLKFSSEAGLMVFGDLIVNGSVTAPVNFTHQTNNKTWAGLSVFGSTKRHQSQINHLHISSARSPRLGLWQPRGATYFVNTNLIADHLWIENNLSEDALNIINSQIEIRDLTISNTLSDAFDCDFCKGRILNSVFNNIGHRSGGDAIDVSGSQLLIDTASFTGVRDKAISGGERSDLTVINAHIKSVNFGIVAKDDTVISASEIHTEQVKYKALMSYSKKSIFGPAELTVEKFDCADPICDHKITAELGSKLTVNGQKIRQTKLDVKNLYSTIMKSDKPK